MPSSIATSIGPETVERIGSDDLHALSVMMKCIVGLMFFGFRDEVFVVDLRIDCLDEGVFEGGRVSGPRSS